MKGVRGDEDLLEQTLDSARHKTNCKDSKWEMEVQSTIGWELLLKGMVTNDWKSVMEHLSPNRNWEDFFHEHSHSLNMEDLVSYVASKE